MNTKGNVMGASTTLDFGRALCAHFGLPAKQVFADVKMNTDANDVFSATVTILLTADDLTGIAMQMRDIKPLSPAASRAIPVIPQPSP